MSKMAAGVQRDQSCWRRFPWSQGEGARPALHQVTPSPALSKQQWPSGKMLCQSLGESQKWAGLGSQPLRKSATLVGPSSQWQPIPECLCCAADQSDADVLSPHSAADQSQTPPPAEPKTFLALLSHVLEPWQRKTEIIFTCVLMGAKKRGRKITTVLNTSYSTRQGDGTRSLQRRTPRTIKFLQTSWKHLSFLAITQ